MNALKKIVKEARITRRQARELRRLKDYSTAHVFRRCADTYMKCARYVKELLSIEDRKMVGAISETGNGWYFGGQHFDSISLLLATVNTELQKQDLQVYELERRLKDEGIAYSALAKSYEDMKLQLSAMVEERDLYSDVVDAAETWLKHHGNGGISEAEANKALRYQVERLGEKANPEKRKCEKPVRIAGGGGVVPCGNDIPCGLHE